MVPRRTRNCQENMALLLRLNTPPYSTASKIYTSLFDHSRLYVVSTDTQRPGNQMNKEPNIIFMKRPSQILTPRIYIRSAVRGTGHFRGVQVLHKQPAREYPSPAPVFFFPSVFELHVLCAVLCSRGANVYAT